MKQRKERDNYLFRVKDEGGVYLRMTAAWRAAGRSCVVEVGLGRDRDQDQDLVHPGFERRGRAWCVGGLEGVRVVVKLQEVVSSYQIRCRVKR